MYEGTTKRKMCTSQPPLYIYTTLLHLLHDRVDGYFGIPVIALIPLERSTDIPFNTELIPYAIWVMG